MVISQGGPWGTHLVGKQRRFGLVMRRLAIVSVEKGSHTVGCLGDFLCDELVAPR